MRLAGKVAIVTGGARGLGLAISTRFAKEGASVVIADLSGADEVAADLVKQGYKALAIQTDVSSEESVAAMVEKTVKTCGTVDILVNNAGIASTVMPQPFEELTVKQWRAILDVNTVGLWLCCRAVSPHMRAQKAGRIINLTSSTAIRGAPFMMHYVASKGAVIAMTRALANELGGDNILVNAVAPGYILTDSNVANADMSAKVSAVTLQRRPVKRHGYPEDIVGTVVYFASEDAGFVSGEIISIDGGGTYH